MPSTEWKGLETLCRQHDESCVEDDKRAVTAPSEFSRLPLQPLHPVIVKDSLQKMHRRKHLSIISRAEGLGMHAMDRGWSTSTVVVDKDKKKTQIESLTRAEFEQISPQLLGSQETQ